MKTFSIKEAVKHGWKLFKAHKKLLILAAIIFLLLSGLDNGRDYHHIGFWALPFGIIFFAVSIFVQIGWYKILLNVEDGKHTSLKEFYTHTELFWEYLWVYVVYMIIVGVGFILFIIPGIYLLLKYGFATMLIVDRKDLSISEAFKESARLTDGKKWELLRFLLAVILINILGMLCLGVGVLVSIPVTTLAYIHVYRELSSKG